MADALAGLKTPGSDKLTGNVRLSGGDRIGGSHLNYFFSPTLKFSVEVFSLVYTYKVKANLSNYS